MNSGVNALGQGNRANASIGRALQLVIRNVGGGRPGEVDRSALGTPGKYTFCFAEAEDSRWAPLHVERGFAPEASTVTLFAGEGVQGIVDQKSRTPESLARTFAACMRVSIIPSSRWRATRCWSCRPSTPGVHRRRLVEGPAARGTGRPAATARPTR
jgi:hypothetical protein